MTKRQELVSHVGYELYKAAAEYARNNRTAEGFNVDLTIAEIVSEASRRNLAIVQDIDSYDWPRLVCDIKKEAKQNVRYHGV